MNDRSRREWEKLRIEGKSHFVIKSGVLRWGLSTAILYTLYLHLLENGWTLSGNIISKAVLAFLLFPIGGYFWGIWVWSWQEKKYRKSSD